MFVEQKDLLWDLEKKFVKKFMDITTKETRSEGDHLFHEGDKADHMFTLIKGRIRLTVGDEGKRVYLVSHPGEVFGWSSVVGRKAYTATAKCLEPTIIVKIHKDKLRTLLESDPKNAAIFYRKISETLGNRLLQSYTSISESARSFEAVSYGTRQVQIVGEA